MIFDAIDERIPNGDEFGFVKGHTPNGDYF
jgi:hypothetical protein